MILYLCLLVWCCTGWFGLTDPARVSGDDKRSPATAWQCGVLPQPVAIALLGAFTVPFADPAVAFGERAVLSVRIPFFSSALAVVSVTAIVWRDEGFCGLNRELVDGNFVVLLGDVRVESVFGCKLLLDFWETSVKQFDDYSHIAIHYPQLNNTQPLTHTSCKELIEHYIIIGLYKCSVRCQLALDHTCLHLHTCLTYDWSL
jgi:hypothetical protein